MVFLTVTLLKISSFQQNIVRHTKEQGSMTHTQEKKSTETVSECFQMLELADDNFKAHIINRFKVLKEAMFKELKESMMTTTNQQRFSIWIHKLRNDN